MTADLAARTTDDPSVWTADQFATQDWITHLTEDDLLDLERGLAGSTGQHVGTNGDAPSDFEFGAFRERLDDIVETLEHGRGFALLRGLPVHSRFTEQQARHIYWSIARYMGRLVTQNRKGDLIGHIRDLGYAGPYDRTYATNAGLGFHTDSTDFVGLLCLRPALYGGDSFIASSTHMYNVAVEEHPEYLPILLKNFATDWRNEQSPGSPGWYMEPLYCNVDGVVSGSLRTARVVSAMRFEDVARLTPDEISCLMYLESLPKRPGYALSMTLEEGDMQIINNYVLVHDRSSFVDSPDDPTHQRQLLRLWISRDERGRKVCPEYAHWRRGYAAPGEG